MQQILQHKGALFGISTWLKDKGATQVLLVAGKHLQSEEIFLAFRQSLQLPFRLLHPPDGLLQVAEIPVIDGADAVIVIGGGKTIDFAKALIHASKKTALFVAVPTTGGSGSEATPFAVLYSGKEKVSIDHPHLLPQTIVLDPALIKSLSLVQKGISGADAFSQCVESVWNVKSSKDSEEPALKGMWLLWNYLPAFLYSTDDDLTMKVLTGAMLSGRAIAQTRTTGPHALSYYLTAHYTIPHGQAVALFLPLFFLYNKQPHVAVQLKKICEVLQVNTAEEGFEASRNFFRRIGLALTFKELGLASLNVDDLLASVNQERFSNNPVPFDALALKALILRYLL